MKQVPFGVLAAFLVTLGGCASTEVAEVTAENPVKEVVNMTAELNVGWSKDDVVGKFGKPKVKYARTEAENEIRETWVYPDAELHFNNDKLVAFEPKRMRM